jgi:predicted dehydrogenase
MGGLTDKPRVAIIGCGLIGQKRAKWLGTAQLAACVDVQVERAQALARSSSNADRILVSNDWRAVLEDDSIEIVIVATMNNMLAEITLGCIQAGKHVLVEKPAARTPPELLPLIEAADKNNRLIRVGFNHRYHPALRKAFELFQGGALGEMMFLRGRYGHGGRIGYDKEWRADPNLSGGGELLDQGVHLIDLARCFLGDFDAVSGFAYTYFWQMPVDDNGFMILRTPQQQVAHLHVSCTEWKNLFSFEIYGRNAKLHVEGLGGSYGVERLTYYKMLPEMGPPETTIWEYVREDNSWGLEFAEFLEDIRLNRQPSANLHDAYAALDIVQKIYQESGYDHRA